jgi:hypothetical protein
MRCAMNSRLVLAAAAALYLGVAFDGANAAQLSNTFTHLIDHPAIGYKTTPPSDPVAILNQRLQDGTVRLSADGPSGYLRSVLAALNVAVDSQIAVFAKDSLQRAIISPANPRTLFFNDSVAVGWVRTGIIELAAQDPVQGTIFYTLNSSLLAGPRFVRRNDCLTCHYSFSTAGVPGMLVRSAGEFAVTHTLPLERRWGGWYVTGAHGSLHHLGNVDLDRLFQSPRPEGTSNWSSFEGKFDTSGYLSPYSDIVALMVFDHQMHLLNLLARIGWEARVASYREQTRSSGGDDEPVSLADAAVEVVDYMLFINEAPIEHTLKGSSGFAERFERQGPADRAGRSLRQFGLRRRLMRFPCSYLIYSPVFDNLPGPAKSAIYRRLWQVLSGADRGPQYRRLSFEDRRAIVEILRETRSDLPADFQAVVR